MHESRPITCTSIHTGFQEHATEGSACYMQPFFFFFKVPCHQVSAQSESQGALIPHHS